MHKNTVINQVIYHQDFKVQQVWTLFILALMVWPIFLHAGSQAVQDKVSSDLAKLNSFNVTSQEIAARPPLEILTIGADGNCDIDSAVHGIQTLIGKGVAEIRVASNGVYTDNLLIHDQSVVIRGGFADCTAANANNQVASELTVIDGSNLAAPVIRFTGNITRHVVRLENLVLTGGTSSGAAVGGGLSLDETDLELQMLRVVLANNSGAAGAGMYVNNGIGINSADIDIFAQDLLVVDNLSNTAAGGVFCLGTADVTLTGMSAVANNLADNSAGIKMQNGCEISFYSEYFPQSLALFSGIFNNISDDEAGGAFITLGAELYLFGQKMCDGSNCLGSNSMPIYVANNHADDDGLGNDDGGGLYLSDSAFLTEVYANGLIMDNNTAGGNGGGAYVGANAKLTIERQSGGCWNQDRCNLIIANRSGTSVGLGGGFFVEGGALEISHSYVEENRADFGAAISATGDSAVVVIEGVVFDDNGDDGFAGFSDFQIIRASLGATFSIRHATFADNNATESVISVDPALDSSLSMFASIVSDPSSGNVFGPINGLLSIDCLVAHEHTSYNGSNVVVGLPSFVDRSSGDYHLKSDSPAIDLCEEFQMIHPLDMDSELRGWDDPANPNEHGMFDAGADESYASDVIFKDGFD